MPVLGYLPGRDWSPLGSLSTSLLSTRAWEGLEPNRQGTTCCQACKATRRGELRVFLPSLACSLLLLLLMVPWKGSVPSPNNFSQLSSQLRGAWRSLM